MKKSLLISVVCGLLTQSLVSQVNLSTTGRVQDIITDFSFRQVDGQYNRIVQQTGWISGIGDYIALKHGGANTEEYTFGIRISDGYGFDFGRNDFATSFMKIKPNGYTGIGIGNPSTQLEVHSQVRVNNPATRGSSFLKIDRGSEGKDAAVVAYGQDGNYLWHTGLLYDGGGLTPDYYISKNGAIRDGNGTVVHLPELVIKTNGYVGIGTRYPDSKLTVKGKIHAEEVKVDLSVPGPDYVFKEYYDLKPLEEVKNYIEENGHLPNIPSAKEMEENGIQLFYLLQ
ncbi:MAG: hypothetical protein AAFY00_03850 [Bacteroidota bacterium]